MHTGQFITFEGIDGAGKSTHIPFVCELIKKAGKEVVATREPGGTPLGEALRDILLHQSMDLETETLLMFASRREHLAQVIMPALHAGKWVVSDRFTDATFAYQGGGRQLSLDKLNVLEQWVHPDLQPDLTLLFDVPLEVAKERLQRERVLDKFEQEKDAFFMATRNEYLRRAKAFPERFVVIDSTQSIADIQTQLERIMRSRLQGAK